MKTIEELGVSPCPWGVEESSDGELNPVDAKGVYLVEFMPNEDARLISAAPELYECLCKLWNFYDHSPWGELIESRIKAALEKAGGVA